MSEPMLWLWRHPRPRGGAGLCYGRSDLDIDRRRAKRLAQRILRTARRHALPRVVWTSPLKRCRAVGRWLNRWGFVHRIDARLSELDFGAWEGRAWSEIAPEAFDAWVQAFATHAPGGGESLSQFAARVQAFTQQHAEDAAPVLAVTHGGWMVMARWQLEHPGRLPSARDWSSAPAHGCGWRLLP